MDMNQNAYISPKALNRKQTTRETISTYGQPYLMKVSYATKTQYPKRHLDCSAASQLKPKTSKIKHVKSAHFYRIESHLKAWQHVSLHNIGQSTTKMNQMFTISFLVCIKQNSKSHGGSVPFAFGHHLQMRSPRSIKSPSLSPFRSPPRDSSPRTHLCNLSQT